MADVYGGGGGGGVLSFSKVPCTPVTGAFANYFDVFGDVDHQRIGTGSSIASSISSASSCGAGEVDELPMLVDKNSPSSSSQRILKITSASSLLSSSPYLCKSCNKRLVSSKPGRANNSKNNSSNNSSNGSTDSFDVTSVIQRDPYIVFLQEKQVEILGALHQEIRVLKHENAELKFQIHVILQQQDSTAAAQTLCSYQEKTIIPNASESSESAGIAMTISGDREKMLELELESATKMIQELKWVQQHYENKIRMQETKMEDLMRQLNINSSSANNENAWPIQMQTSVAVYPTVKATNPNNRPLKSGRQKSPNVNKPPDLISRRNSLQSILPDNYKDQVATLPPIKQLGNPTSSLRAPNTLLNPSSASANNAQYENNMLSKSSRRSSLIHSSTTRNNNNTPASFCGEETSHFKD